MQKKKRPKAKVVEATKVWPKPVKWILPMLELLRCLVPQSVQAELRGPKPKTHAVHDKAMRCKTLERVFTI